jgi:hypothetical protein
MKARIEFGSFNRDKNNPILLKEKIGPDGSSSVRIYQRKDIESIINFKDKIKTIVKYSVEDFFIHHKNFQPLLEKIGLNKIHELDTSKVENPYDLLQSIKSDARIGFIDKTKEDELKNLLIRNAIHQGNQYEYEYTFYKGKYKNEDFFSDLEKFIGRNKKDSVSDSDSDLDQEISEKINIVKTLKECIEQNTILDQKSLEGIILEISELEKSIQSYFKDKKFYEPCIFNTKSPQLSSTQNRLYSLESLESEITGKLAEVKNQIKENSNNPKNEDVKKNLLNALSQSAQIKGQIPEIQAKKQAEIQGAIDVLFSTNWWISEERKLQSLKEVQTYFKDRKGFLPEAIQDAIFGNEG